MSFSSEKTFGKCDNLAWGALVHSTAMYPQVFLARNIYFSIDERLWKDWTDRPIPPFVIRSRGEKSPPSNSLTWQVGPNKVVFSIIHTINIRGFPSDLLHVMIFRHTGQKLTSTSRCWDINKILTGSSEMNVAPDFKSVKVYRSVSINDHLEQ